MKDKIFLIIPTLNQGGAERVISELANYFIKFNVEVHLILLAQSEDFYSISQKVNVHRLGFVNKGKLAKILSIFITFFKLRKVLKAEKPDAILSFMDKYNIFTLLASFFLGLKVFVSDRSNPNRKINVILKISKKLFYPYAYGIIAQTRLAKDVLEQITLHKNINVIPNPVKKVNLYPEVLRENIIINIGRMVPEKGQKYLIEAFSKINNDKWKLVILGDGPLRNELEVLVEKMNLTESVLMPGATNSIDFWLAKSSFFVLSSTSEGFPNVLIEAMSAGLPCISFDCDAGPRDIIKNNFNGILVEKENIKKLAEAMRKLINEKDTYINISINSFKARDSYNIDSIGKKYLSFLLKS